MFVTHSMYIQVVNIQVIGSQVELFKDLKRRVERAKCSAQLGNSAITSHTHRDLTACSCITYAY